MLLFPSLLFGFELGALVRRQHSEDLLFELLASGGIGLAAFGVCLLVTGEKRLDLGLLLLAEVEVT